MATQPQATPPAASPPPPAPPRATDTVPAGTEDARFIAFAKDNIGLLASVASVPLLSSAAGALKPPMRMDQLTVLSSLLCVVVFAACFTLRGLLGAAPRSRHTVVKALPGVASLLIVGLAVYLIAWFSALQKQQEIAESAQKPAIAAAAPEATNADASKSEKNLQTKPAPVAAPPAVPENLRT